MKDLPLRVCDCNLCRIFSHREFKGKIYYPETIEELDICEFAIIEDEETNTPMIVASEHIPDISREYWGRVLYRCRKLFGDTVRLNTRMNKIKDHWHCFVSKPSRY